MPLATYKDLCIDAVDPVASGEFWAAALGWELHRLDDGDTCLKEGTEVRVWLNRVPEPKTAKNRVHLDVSTEDVDRLVTAGATVVDPDSFRWTILADPDGQELCAFVREEPVTRRLYELVWQTGNSAAACHRIAAWWAEVLGARLVDDEHGYSYVEQVPSAPFESLDFVPVPEPKTVKNRVHIDVTTDDVDALLAAGATRLRAKGDGIGWDVLADPDGNEFCAFTTP